MVTGNTTNAVRETVAGIDGEFTADDVIRQVSRVPEFCVSAVRAELLRLFHVGLLWREVRAGQRGREFVYRRTPLAMVTPSLITKKHRMQRRIRATSNRR